MEQKISQNKSVMTQLRAVTILVNWATKKITLGPNRPLLLVCLVLANCLYICIIPVNVWFQKLSIPPPQKAFLLTLHSSQASYIYLNFWAFESLPPPRNFQSLPWGEYGYFLELHNKTKFSIEYYHMTYLLKRSLATEVTNFATCIGQWCAKL